MDFWVHPFLENSIVEIFRDDCAPRVCFRVADPSVKLQSVSERFVFLREARLTTGRKRQSVRVQSVKCNIFRRAGFARQAFLRRAYL